MITTPAGPIKLTASFGISCFDGQNADLDGILADADEAMYAAKRSGRAAWVGLRYGATQIRAEQVEQMLQTPDAALAAGTLLLQASVAEEDLLRTW